MTDAANKASLAGLASRSPHPVRAFSVPQLLALVTVATLVPLLLFGAVALHIWDRNERSADAERLLAHADSLAQGVDREIRRHRQIVEGLAGSPEIQSGDPQRFWQFAEDISRHLGGDFVLIDRQMRQLTNGVAASGAPAPQAGATEDIGRVLKTGQTFVTDYRPSAITGAMQFAILAPVGANGEVRHVLGYALPFDAIQSILLETYRPAGWLAAVLDRNGTIVARSEAFDAFFGQPAKREFVSTIGAETGTTESVDLQGRASLSAWRTSQHGWKVLVWAPKDVLAQRSMFAVRALGAAALAALLTSLLASWLASRLIRGPADRLVDAAHSLGEGQIVHFVKTRMKEANAIGASLSEASELIRQREDDLRASQANMRLVMRELSHRSKNLLAMVQALARQSARASANYADFQSRFVERLQSLSMSHDLLVQTDWTSVPLRELAGEQLRPFVDQMSERVILEGDPLLLKPEAAQTVGMALHELGSNAVKHGSLSAPAGTVAISWRIEIDGQPTLVLIWRERGGPPVQPPVRRGFGSVMLQNLLPQSLQGEAASTWEEAGFAWTLRAPMTSVAWLASDPADDAMQSSGKPTGNAESLSGAAAAPD